MSGHSKWSTIKHKKALVDQKRGKIFSKLVRQIQVAAKKDPNPETNSALRLAIEKAKEVNMPLANIQRAIKKATGAIKGEELEEIILEGYGPEGSAFLIEAITDNKNRTIAEVKHLFDKNGGRLAEKGAVLWLFQKKVIFKIPTKNWTEELELKLIDAGLEDINLTNEVVMLLAPLEKESSLKEILRQEDIEIISEEFDWQPQTPLKVSEQHQQKIQQLVNLLEDLEDVKGVYTNLE